MDPLSVLNRACEVARRRLPRAVPVPHDPRRALRIADALEHALVRLDRESVCSDDVADGEEVRERGFIAREDVHAQRARVNRRSRQRERHH